MNWNAGRNSLQSENSFLKRKSYDINRRSSSADGRARNSGGPSNVVKVRSSSEERRWTGPRRSSLLNEPKGSMKDPRPLHDKAYQKRKIQQLIEFLQETNFPYPLTPAKLIQCSKKDFENIFQHFIMFWDDRYVVKKIDEEAPKILKDLCYPFIPNKSAFQYVARTNWPQLLGVLLFLMDLAMSLNKFDPKSDILNNCDEEHRVLFEFIFNCYWYKNEDEESVKQMFTKIVKQFRVSCDVNELMQENEKLKNGIENDQSEIDKINHLEVMNEEQNADIARYEDYFLKMKERHQRKVDACTKISDELASKEAKLRELTAIRDRKQEAYDAQGFDGRKQVSYYEEQKKELVEKLQAKKAAVKDLQQQCWEAELQHSEILDKGASACETFNELYSHVSHLSDNVLGTLQNIQDPQVRSLCSNLKVVFPDCRMQPTLNTQGPIPRIKLEEIKQKVDSTTAILDSLKCKQSQVVSENKLKISGLSIANKAALVEVTQKEKEMNSNEKQVKEKCEGLEAQYDEALKTMEKVQAQRIEAENKNKELLEELKAIQNLKKDKLEMFQNYLKEQQELFSYYAKSIKDAEKLSEEYGEEIFKAVQEKIK